MESKRILLSKKTQEFFGIEGDNLSPSGWAEAVAELNTMRDVDLPTDKLRVLLRAKDVVLKTFTAEHPPQVRADGKTKSKTLAGDDFQPIFIYMVCQCDVPGATLRLMFRRFSSTFRQLTMVSLLLCVVAQSSRLLVSCCGISAIRKSLSARADTI